MTLAPAVHAELRGIDPELPIHKIDTIAEQIDDVLVQDRLMTTLSTFFGGVGMVLACVGLFGLLAYTTARRTGEIGIRLALGASPASIVELVLRDGLLLIGTGVAIGLPAAFVATRFMSSRLYGISPFDSPTIVAASLLIAGTGALAAVVPARRAARTDPKAALRSE
jgi:ABC-type antimicrobial peptide transport system permease subunit